MSRQVETSIASESSNKTSSSTTSNQSKPVCTIDLI